MANPSDPKLSSGTDPYQDPSPYDEGEGLSKEGTTQNGAKNGGQNSAMSFGTPAVATAPGKIIGMIGGAVGLVIVIIMMFSGGEETPEKPKEEVVVTPGNDRPVETAPPIAPPPIAVAPPVIEQPPPPVIAAPVNVDPETLRRPTTEQMIQRRQSEILIMNGGGGGGGGNNAGSGSRQTSNDPNQAFADGVIAGTQSEQAVATRIGNVNTTIGQGKVIDAVLETAINTDLPGTLRAIVSRDVYPESGRYVPIPKGSRLIGTYNTQIQRGQKRVFVVWTRIIRPDGVDIEVASPGVDQIGRAGVAGAVDNKYFETFSAAALTSLVTIAVGYGVDELTGDRARGDQTRNPDGSVDQRSTATGQAVTQSMNNVGTATQGIIQGMVDARPTITVNQGTVVKVMVNRDLLFPPDVVDNSRFIP
jgi:type IV secretion system protein VirB10